MKRTNTRAYKTTVRAYLADCITDDNGDAFADHRAAFQHARNRFETEYNYDANKRRYPNTQQRVAEWLAGLALNTECYYSDIIALAEKWHECELTEKQRDRVCENWFNHLAFHLVTTWANLNINAE